MKAGGIAAVSPWPGLLPPVSAVGWWPVAAIQRGLHVQCFGRDQSGHEDQVSPRRGYSSRCRCQRGFVPVGTSSGLVSDTQSGDLASRGVSCRQALRAPSLVARAFAKTGPYGGPVRCDRILCCSLHGRVGSWRLRASTCLAASGPSEPGNSALTGVPGFERSGDDELARLVLSRRSGTCGPRPGSRSTKADRPVRRCRRSRSPTTNDPRAG
jgi:hypothetical protein